MPDKLPRGWVRTTLGDIRRDASVGISQKEMASEAFELYSVPAFSEGKPEVVTGDQVGSNKVVVAPGDVLICKINPRINRAWLVAESHGPRQIASTEWIVFSKQEGIASEFVRYFFTQDVVKNYLAGNVSGVGGSLMRVRPVVVEKIPINLPPTLEQERIVAKLDALLSRVAAGEAAARRAQERLKRYRAAVLHAAVTGELTRDWRKTHKPDETGVQLLKRLLQERRARWEEAQFKRLHAAGKPPKDDSWKKRYREPGFPKLSDVPILPKNWIWVCVEQLGEVQLGIPTGKLIAVQIKSGASYLSEPDANDFVFRGELTHPDYWLQHDLPVIVVLYDPSSDAAYWQSIKADHVSKTPAAWKMSIPKTQTLQAASAPGLATLASRHQELQAALREFTCPHCGQKRAPQRGHRPHSPPTRTPVSGHRLLKP